MFGLALFEDAPEPQRKVDPEERDRAHGMCEERHRAERGGSGDPSAASAIDDFARGEPASEGQGDGKGLGPDTELKKIGPPPLSTAAATRTGIEEHENRSCDAGEGTSEAISPGIGHQGEQRPQTGLAQAVGMLEIDESEAEEVGARAPEIGQQGVQLVDREAGVPAIRPAPETAGGDEIVGKYPSLVEVNRVIPRKRYAIEDEIAHQPEGDATHERRWSETQGPAGETDALQSRSGRQGTEENERGTEPGEGFPGRLSQRQADGPTDDERDIVLAKGELHDDK